MSMQLIERNHPVYAVNWEGKTPLHYAVIYDFPKIAQALIANGANKSAQDIYDLKAADYINPVIYFL
jgi:ankyrin repeat protein